MYMFPECLGYLGLSHFSLVLLYCIYLDMCLWTFSWVIFLFQFWQMNGYCGGRRNFPLLGSFGWSNNQIDMRKINKIKWPNLVTYVHRGTPSPTGARDPAHRRGSDTERETAAYLAFRAEDEVRRLGASEGRKVLLRTARCTDGQ